MSGLTPEEERELLETVRGLEAASLRLTKDCPDCYGKGTVRAERVCAGRPTLVPSCTGLRCRCERCNGTGRVVCT